MNKKTLRVAILHEMLVKLGGAEKVVEKLLHIFPDADLFTLIYDEEKVGKIFPKKIINSQVFSLPSQKIYKWTKNQRFCLPSMPRSIETLDFTQYDLVIASSSGFAHGAITKPDTQFMVYYHSPARYMWDWTNEYKKDIGWQTGIKGFMLNKLFLKLRQWDVIASSRVDTVIANSDNTASRIQKYYRKDSHVLYPPVEVKRFQKKLENNNVKNTYFTGDNTKYYIIISALTEFKKLDIAINGFNNLPEQNLLVIGAGDAKNSLENLITGDNILFSGPQYGDDLVQLVQNSEGLIFPGEEDFGIVPIEVMAAGKPVFALRAGGLLETVKEGVTGEFFDDANGSDFVNKFQNFNQNNIEKKYSSVNCKKQAELFSDTKFEENLKKLIK